MYQSKKEQVSRSEESGQVRKLLRIRNVVALTGISKSYIYSLCSKGLFPKPIELVPGGNSVAWVESEVQDWIQSRINKRDMEI